MIDLKTLIRNVGLITFFGVIFVYVIWRGHTAIFGIKIETNISNGQSFETTLTTFSGNAKNAIKFSIDGREVILDEQGNFSLPLLLQPGYSIMELQTEDRFGRTREETIQLFSKYQPASINEQTNESIKDV